MTEQPVPAHPPENDTPDPDTESKLAELYRLSNQEKAIKTEREALRDEILESLDGSRYFIDENGNKLYGYRVQPEPIEVDVALLESYVPTEVINEVTDRVINKPKFTQAVSAQRISPEVFVRVAKRNKGKAHIRFGDPAAPPPPFV